MMIKIRRDNKFEYKLIENLENSCQYVGSCCSRTSTWCLLKIRCVSSNQSWFYLFVTVMYWRAALSCIIDTLSKILYLCTWSKSHHHFILRNILFRIASSELHEVWSGRTSVVRWSLHLFNYYYTSIQIKHSNYILIHKFFNIHKLFSFFHSSFLH